MKEEHPTEEVRRMNESWRRSMNDETTIYVEQWVTFHLINNKWTVNHWLCKPDETAPAYRLRIPVPAELIGRTIVAEVEREREA